MGFLIDLRFFKFVRDLYALVTGSVGRLKMEIDEGIFNDILTTLNHARIFIDSRQRMHRDGVRLYDKLVSLLEPIASQQASSTDACLPCPACGKMVDIKIDNNGNVSGKHR